MKRRKYHRNKKPTETQKRQVEQTSQAVADRPAFGSPPVVSEPVPSVTTNWLPDGSLVIPESFNPGAPVHHQLTTSPPSDPTTKIAVELYVENTTDEDIILRHVTAGNISVLVENSQIEPGRTRRVLMVLANPEALSSPGDGFMFCQGQAKNQCIVRCQGKTLWVALQSGSINPLMHDMSAFTQSSFPGQRYLLCFKPPFRSH